MEERRRGEVLNTIEAERAWYIKTIFRLAVVIVIVVAAAAALIPK
jgi:hypothetical protein